MVVKQPFGNSTTRYARRDLAALPDYDDFPPLEPKLSATTAMLTRAEPARVSADREQLLAGMPISWFQLLDQDGDGFVTLDELEFALSMAYDSPQQAYTARRAFGLPEPVDLLEALDRDHDDRISRHELSLLSRSEVKRSAETCAPLRRKTEMCNSRHVLQCSSES